MEFVDGVTLRQLLAASRVSPHEALAIVPQICDALQYAHDLGIVHRDIKPENILMDRRGRVKVADFGLAKIMGSDEGRAGSPLPAGAAATSFTESGKVLGTPNYMAPEQVSHPAEVDHRADIYALGVVFYQMLTGELPGKRLEPPSRKVQIDVRLDEVVLRALEKKPEQRYQQASVLKTQVETIAGTSGADIPTRPPEPGANDDLRPSRRFSRKAIVGVCWSALFFASVLLPFTLRLVIGDNVALTLTDRILLTLRNTVLPLGVAAPFGTTILGWIAISEIRRSTGRLYGAGLAFFDGVLFPLLALDLVIYLCGALVQGFWIAWLGHDGHLGTIYGAWIRLVVNVVVLAACAIVDFRVVRATWRAVNKPFPDSPKPPVISPDGTRPQSAATGPRETADTLLAYVAVAFAGMSGVLGFLTWLRMPDPPQILVWSILAAALIGLSLGILTRKTLRGKTAIVIASVNTAVWLAVALIVPVSSSQHIKAAQMEASPDVEVSYRIFEADPGLVDHLVPPQTRERGDSPVPDVVHSGAPPNAVSQTTEISSDTLTTLLGDAKSEEFANARRQVSIWPRLADGLSYVNTNGGGVGGIGGFEGIRWDGGGLKMRLEYHLDHIVKVRAAVSAEIFFRGRRSSARPRANFFHSLRPERWHVKIFDRRI